MFKPRALPQPELFVPSCQLVRPATSFFYAKLDPRVPAAREKYWQPLVQRVENIARAIFDVWTRATSFSTLGLGKKFIHKFANRSFGRVNQKFAVFPSVPNGAVPPKLLPSSTRISIDAFPQVTISSSPRWQSAAIVVAVYSILPGWSRTDFINS